MTEQIRQLSIKQLLDGHADYEIPMYQRNYAWGESEIEQLIQDIWDSAGQPGAATGHYYIGTLVVYRRQDSPDGRPVYEIIDGQQRLTTLFLLAACFSHDLSTRHAFDMSWFQRPCLRFESRPGSLTTLKAIFEGRTEHNTAGTQPDARNSHNIIAGHDTLRTRLPALLGSGRSSPEQACARLSKFAAHLFHNTQIMLVPVPKDTELNHYFEIMNSRGEQLEKHEVLKARLMSVLTGGGAHPQAREWLRTLNKVWTAVASMERYVQMGFTRPERDRLFGEQDWGRLQPQSFDALNAALNPLQGPPAGSASSTGLRLTELIRIRPAQPDGKANRKQREDAPDRYRSVINFPNFLLQVLRISTGENTTLDDKNLLPAFTEHLLKPQDAVSRIKRFIHDLLRCRFLHDHYVIKREHLPDEEGWSLKRLKYSHGGPAYVNTFGAEDGSPQDNRRVLMLLSALETSAPNPTYKHWLNAALHYLYHAGDITAHGYLQHMESIARCFVYDRLLTRHEEAPYYDIIHRRQGRLLASDWEADIDEKRLSFHHISTLLLNYMDYLLWTRYGEPLPNRHFQFTTGRSVDHYYPQHPKYEIPPLPADLLHCLGNLCLISASRNSSLNNHSPEAKRHYYQRGHEDSLKQGLMMKEEKWGMNEIIAHHDAMLELLKNDLHYAHVTS